jgi:hypothetical protein
MCRRKAGSASLFSLGKKNFQEHRMYRAPIDTEAGIRRTASVRRNVFLGARVIAMAGVIAFAAACTDTTTPQKVATPTPETPATPAPTTPLGLLGASLETETTNFLPGMHDDTARADLQAALNTLGVDLVANNVSASTKDLATCRGMIAVVDDVQQVELAPISLALDVVELALSQ